MFRLIGLWKYYKELKTIQEKAQGIEDKLQKYIRDNEQEFSKLPKNKDSDGIIKMTIEFQEQQIIDEIQSLEESFGQLTQHSEDRQLIPTTDEDEQRNSTDISDTIQNAISISSGDRMTDRMTVTKNKTLSEWFRGIPRGNLSLRKEIPNWLAIIPLIIEGVKIAITIGDKYADDLARRCEEEKRDTQKLLNELRRRTENYYDSFRSKNNFKRWRSWAFILLVLLGLLLVLLWHSEFL